MSSHDNISKKLSRTEALKLLRKLLRDDPACVIISGHAMQEMRNDSLSTADVMNVLLSPASRILTEGEKHGDDYRYRVGTNKYVVVIKFRYNRDGIVVITVWKIKRS